MHIENLNLNEALLQRNSKLYQAYIQLQKLMEILRTKQLPAHIIQTINTHIREINLVDEYDFKLQNLIKKKQSIIIKLIEKELKIVPINYYRNIWLPVGMSGFGLPIGVALGLSLGNMGLLGIGLPIGLAIGVAIGMAMDNKAREEGRQLDLEMK